MLFFIQHCLKFPDIKEHGEKILHVFQYGVFDKNLILYEYLNG